MAAGIGISALGKVVGINHLKTSVVRDWVPTEYKCNNCQKTFSVTSDGNDIHVLDDDAPVNVAKKRAKESHIYSCKLISVDVSSWWNRFNTRRLLEAYPDLSSEQIDFTIAHLPQIISFETKEYLDGFITDIATYGGKAIKHN